MLTLPLVAVKLDRSVTEGVLNWLKFENSPSSDSLFMLTAVVATNATMDSLSPHRKRMMRPALPRRASPTLPRGRGGGK